MLGDLVYTDSKVKVYYLADRELYTMVESMGGENWCGYFTKDAVEALGGLKQAMQWCKDGTTNWEYVFKAMSKEGPLNAQ